MRRSGLRPSLLVSLIAVTLLAGACLNPIMDPPLSYLLRFQVNEPADLDPDVDVLDAPYQIAPRFTAVLVGDRVVLPGPGTITNPPDVLLGWNTRESGTGIFYTPGEAMTMPSHDVTLYAVWGPGGTTYTVTYNANGADSGTVPANQTKTEGIDLTLQTNSGGLALAGYTFAGWNTQADGSGTSYPEGAIYTDDANVTLYAEWTALPTHTITYNANGAIGAVPTDAGSYYAGQAITIAGQGALTNGGDSFVGWNTEAGGGGTWYAPGPNTMPAGNLDLYAQWSAVPTYTVTFDANGGSAVAPETVPDGGLVPEPGAPVRAGNIFNGWYADEELITLWNFATDTVSANITLNAGWTEIDYLVSFNINGGDTGTMGDQSVTYNGSITLNPNTFTLTGHRFMGWAETAVGPVTLSDGALYTHTIETNRTFYAVWEEEFSVTYTDLDADLGGTPPVDANAYIASQTVTVLGNPGALARSNHTFGGWTDGTDNYVAGNDFAMPSSNVTLNPIWVPDATFTVTYNANGADGGTVPADQTKTEGIALTLASNTGGLVLTGFTFAGWNTEADGNGTAYLEAALYSDDANVTLYAEWTPEPEFAGGTGIAGDPYQVATATHLDNVRNHLGAEFLQIANIDLGVSPWNEGDGWEPIGTDATPFTGTFDGGGFTILGLTIDRSEVNVGLFGRVSEATIERVLLEGVSVFGLENTGALIGSSTVTDLSLVRRSSATGTVTSSSYHIGGLIGFAGEMMIDRSFSAVSVESTLDAASLRIGGLIGRASSVTINDSYAVGTVTATGSQGFIGGLLGSGTGTSINRSYAVGRVSTGGATAGGLVGDDVDVNVNDSFYDTYTTGLTVGSGLPRPTASMLQQSNFVGWNFFPGTNWAIDEDTSYPYLQWYTGPAPVPATAFALRDSGPANGWIFYDKGFYSDGWRYLEAAPTDASIGIAWGGSGTLVDPTSTDIGTGLENTDQIMLILGAGSYAAELARSQNIVGFTDWFLPSAGELDLMYENLHVQAVGGFAAESYWASSEADATYAYIQNFGVGTPFTTLKSNLVRVRPARRF